MIKKYRKRYVAEALQLTTDNLRECLEFIGNPCLILQAPTGHLGLRPGDYILKDEHGRFTTCEETMFHKVFEEAPDSRTTGP